MKFPWRRSGKGQSISNTVVFRDVIQIAGSGNVTISGNQQQHYRIENLPTATATVSKERARAQPARLLHSRYEAVPFIGRHDEIARLDEWMSQPEQLGVRLIHAGGGQGKTRLMTHYATQSARAGWAVWRALYAPDSDIPQDPVELGGSSGVLVLVDYADRWLLTHLRRLVAQLHVLALERGISMRVLMVARSATHWWPTFAHDLEGGFDIAADALELTPLGTQLDRATVFSSAATAFAAAMGVNGDRPVIPPAEIDLAQPGFTSVLSLHLAALVTVDSQLHGADLPDDQAALSGYLLRREQTHWTRLFEIGHITARPEVMRRVVWLATLIGPVTPHPADGILRHVGLVSTSDRAHELMDDHSRCYPSEDPHTVLEGLHPDRLGEDFVALSIPGRTPNGAQDMIVPDPWTGAAVQRLLDTATEQATPVAWWTPQVMTNLVETARRWPHVAAEILFPVVRNHPQALLAAGDAAVERFVRLDGIDLAVLEAMESCYPQHCRELDIALTVALISTKAYPDRLAAEQDPARQARIHRIHAQRLNDAGAYSAARAAATESARLLRSRVAVDPAELAAALIQLSIAEFRLGRTGDAVGNAREAMAQYLGLSSRDRHDHLDDIAVLANNYGTWLASEGDTSTALTMTETAVEVGRALVRDSADQHVLLPGLASSLHNLGYQLSIMGRDTEALTAIEEAVALRRDLVHSKPYDHLGDLAESLRLLSIQLARLGRTDGALAGLREAMLIMEVLVQRKPTVYQEASIIVCRQMVGLLLDIDRREDAVEPAEQAVQGLRTLVGSGAVQHSSALAEVLQLLGDLLADQQRSAEALLAAEEALSLRRQFQATGPEAESPALAACLATVAMRLSQAGRMEQAEPLAGEAVLIYRGLAESDVSYRLPYAGALEIHDAVLVGLDRGAEGLPMLRETVTLYRRLVEKDAVHRSGLVAALANIGRRAADSTDEEEAVTASAEAVELCWQLAAGHAGIDSDVLADALLVHGTNLFAKQRIAESVALCDEAVGLYQQLVADRPDAYLPHLAEAWLQLAIGHAADEQFQDAQAAAAQSLSLYRYLSKADPYTHQLGFAHAAEYQGMWAVQSGDPLAAMAPFNEALAAYRNLSKREMNPDHLARVAAMLHQIAHVGMLTGHVGNVHPAIRESVAIYSSLNAHHAGEYDEELNAAISTRTAILRYFDHYWAWVREQEEAKKRQDRWVEWIGGHEQ
ncbi:tetratricopeptide repeat protein [Nocardia sp. NPDC051321]|uniref:tetratricopeptide repeat protein n=1 Tax=Nocardia sp. NPDC051321 TaxID=3364323 RepID=UPI0037A4BD8A